MRKAVLFNAVDLYPSGLPGAQIWDSLPFERKRLLIDNPVVELCNTWPFSGYGPQRVIKKDHFLFGKL
jgi:hypothetical protein